MKNRFHDIRRGCALSLQVGLFGTLLSGSDYTLAQVTNLEIPDQPSVTNPASNATVSIYRFQNGKWVLTKENQPLPLPPKPASTVSAIKLPPAINAKVAGNAGPNRLPPSASVQPVAEPNSPAKTTPVKTTPVIPTKPNPSKAFPKIKIQVVYYRTNNPSVMINGETLYQGGWQGKLQVISITKTNVVLEMDGEQRVFKTD